MRASATIAIFASLAMAGSVPAQPAAEPLDRTLEGARAQQAAAEAESARLRRLAARAQGEVARLRAQQIAAAQAIEVAEARISSADAEQRLVSARLEIQRRRLAHERQPIASLLAGLSLMAQRPPLLAIAERNSVDEFVKIRALLDSTLPAIQRRTAAMSAQLQQEERLQRAVAGARQELMQGRKELAERRQEFVALEQRAIESAASASRSALTAGDVALAAGESVDQLEGGQRGNREAVALGTLLAGLAPAPSRPGTAGPAVSNVPFVYRLPAVARVVDGLGSVNASGIRSRGITLGTGRGILVSTPAAGTVRYSGPFRSYDGIMIIDHGRGWLSLLINLSSTLKQGDTVRLGDPLGRTLGPLTVELSQNGRRVSPALIAGSSADLSKNRKRG